MRGANGLNDVDYLKRLFLLIKSDTGNILYNTKTIINLYLLHVFLFEHPH